MMLDYAGPIQFTPIIKEAAEKVAQGGHSWPSAAFVIIAIIFAVIIGWRLWRKDADTYDDDSEGPEDAGSTDGTPDGDPPYWGKVVSVKPERTSDSDKR